MANDDVLVTWNAETRSFVNDVLTVNDVLKENERRLQRTDKATKNYSKAQESTNMTFGKAATLAASAFAAYESVAFVFDTMAEASNRAADAIEAQAAAQDKLTGVSGGLTAALSASQIQSQAELSRGGDALALRRAAQEQRLTQFDAAIAGGSGVERLTFAIGRFLEQGRQALGVGTEGPLFDAMVQNRRVNEKVANEARKLNETKRVVRDTD